MLGGIGVDLGAIRYEYPGNTGDPGDDIDKWDTTEAYLGIGYGPLTYKFSRVMSKSWFGTQEQKGAKYHDLGIALDLSEQTTLKAHAGFTKFKGEAKIADYKDYSLGIAHSLPQDFSVALTYYKNSFKGEYKALLDAALAAGSTKEVWKNAVVISLSKTF